MEKLSSIMRDGIYYGFRDAEAVAAPNTAEVGQYLRVARVDENGNPTEWEAADPPSNVEDIVFIDTVLEEEVISYSSQRIQASQMDVDELYLRMLIVPTINTETTSWNDMFCGILNSEGETWLEIMPETYDSNCVPPNGAASASFEAMLKKNPASNIGWWRDVRFKKSNKHTIWNFWTTDGGNKSNEVFLRFSAPSGGAFGVGTTIKLTGRRFVK